MDSIIADLQSLHSLVLGSIRERIERALRDVSEAVEESILQHVSSDGAYANIFKGLETRFQQFHYFRSGKLNVDQCMLVSLVSLLW